MVLICFSRAKKWVGKYLGRNFCPLLLTIRMERNVICNWDTSFEELDFKVEILLLKIRCAIYFILCISPITYRLVTKKGLFTCILKETKIDLYNCIKFFLPKYSDLFFLKKLCF